MSVPTIIYWLLDVRPETIAKGWPAGYPFYCGKTIHHPEIRLAQHIKRAQRTDAKVSHRVVACGEHVRVMTVDLVPADGNWRAKERRWIRFLRQHFPDNCNTTDGGDGYILTPARRRAIKRRQKAAAVERERIKKEKQSLARNRIRAHRLKLAAISLIN